MFPGEVLRAGINRLAGDSADFGRGTSMVHQAIDEAFPPPKNKAAQTALRVGAGTALSAVLPGNAVRNAITGFSSNVGSEVGGAAGADLAGDNGRIIGGIGGALVGGLPLSLHRGRRSSAELLQEATHGIDSAAWAKAQRLAQELQARGLKVTPEQLFDNPTGLDTLMKETLESGAGSGKLQSLVFRQGDQAAAAAAAGANSLGPNVGAPKATRDLRLAAEDVLDSTGLTQAQRALFAEKGAKASGGDLVALQEKLANLAETYTASPETAARIKELANRVRHVTDSRDIKLVSPGAPKLVRQDKGAAKWRVEPTTVETPVNVPLGAKATDLDLILKEVKAALDDITISTPATGKLLTGRVTAATKEVEDLLNRLVPSRPIGKEIYGRVMEGREALQASLLGRLAGRSGVKEELPDSLGLLQTTLAGDKAVDSDVARLAAALRDRSAKVKPKAELTPDGQAVAQLDALETSGRATRALPQAARVIWDQAVGKAVAAAANTGRDSQNFGGLLYNDLIGTPAKRANFQQLMQGVGAATEQGKADPKAFANGVISLLEGLRVTSRNRQGIRLSTGDIEAAAGQSALRDAAMAVGPLSRISLLSTKLKQRAIEQQYAKLADLFADPNAIQLIQELGRTPIVSSRHGALLSTLLSASTPSLEGASQ